MKAKEFLMGFPYIAPRIFYLIRLMPFFKSVNASFFILKQIYFASRDAKAFYFDWFQRFEIL